MKKLVLCVSLFLGIAGMTIAQDAPAAVEPAKEAAVQTEELKIGTTVENLQAALTGELSAKERYLAFAAKADEKGICRPAAFSVLPPVRRNPRRKTC